MKEKSVASRNEEMLNFPVEAVIPKLAVAVTSGQRDISIEK